MVSGYEGNLCSLPALSRMEEKKSLSGKNTEEFLQRNFFCAAIFLFENAKARLGVKPKRTFSIN